MTNDDVIIVIILCIRLSVGQIHLKVCLKSYLNERQSVGPRFCVRMSNSFAFCALSVIFYRPKRSFYLNIMYSLLAIPTRRRLQRLRQFITNHTHTSIFITPTRAPAIHYIFCPGSTRGIHGNSYINKNAYINTNTPFIVNIVIQLQFPRFYDSSENC